MIEEISRKYLEIKSINYLKEVQKPLKNFSLSFTKLNDFQLNKFFYKQIGKKYYWIDRLIWTDQNWTHYVSDKNLSTYVLKNGEDLVGYYELIFDENYYNQLIHHFEKRAIKIPKSNRSQAMLLKTADVLPNKNGTALGMHLLFKGTHIFIMPGVPGEMREMVKNHILPNYINKTPTENIITIKTAGIMESHLAEKVTVLMEKYSKSFRFAFLPHFSGVSFRINRMDKNENLPNIKDEFFQAMKPYAYGINNDTLEEVLGLKLINNNFTIATAESCTGGLIGKRLTDTAGSSEYFLGSVTAYSNQLKTSLLDVSNDIINTHGAVSEETALEMAKGIRDKTEADIGISTTGISGPGGGTKTKPVGLVYIGVVTPENSMVKKYNFSYGRNIHREMTTTAALNITRLAIE